MYSHSLDKIKNFTSHASIIGNEKDKEIKEATHRLSIVTPTAPSSIDSGSYCCPVHAILNVNPSLIENLKG